MKLPELGMEARSSQLMHPCRAESLSGAPTSNGGARIRSQDLAVLKLEGHGSFSAGFPAQGGGLACSE